MNSNSNTANLNQISKEEMKKFEIFSHIINKPNLNFMGEKEIVASEKKIRGYFRLLHKQSEYF